MALKLLKNKYVFYTVLVIAVANLLGYLSMHDYESLTLFVVIYALATYFSKNTMVNLSAAILGTALLRNTVRKSTWPWYEREGLENKEGMTESVKEELTPLTPAKVGSEEEEEVTSKNLMNDGGQLASQIAKFKDKLGSGGLSALTKDTTMLAEQQNALMEQMTTMGPLMQNAESLLKTFESSGMMSMVEKVLPFVEKMALPGMGPTKN
jgi:hypothetical protein